MRPGVNITTRETAPPQTAPTDVGTGFMAGIVDSGPLLVESPVYNMEEFEARYYYSGRSATTLTAYDAAEAFFKEGGYKLYVGRVVGASAVTASIAVTAAAATVWTASAKGPGEYGNDLAVEVRTTAQDSNIPAGYYVLRVKTDAGVVLEDSPSLLDKAAGTYWAQTVSQYINLAEGAATADPDAGTYSLASGALDVAGVTDTEWAAGIARFAIDLGPGQVFAPGRTTDTGHDQLADHAEAYNRVAIMDAPDTATVATLTASAVARRSRYAALFAPYVRIAGLTVGTTRLVPPSAIVAGIMARNDGLGHSANEPSAGELGISRTALSLSQTYTDADRQTLNTGGVDIIIQKYGTIKVYGYRTTADPTTDAKWINLGNSRLHRAVSALAAAVGERFVFRQIDGEGRLISEFGAALIGEACLPFYLSGSLYGATPDEAFFVDVGSSVNTPTTIAANELHAVISLRMSPFGEYVQIELVKYLVSEEIPA